MSKLHLIKVLIFYYGISFSQNNTKDFIIASGSRGGNYYNTAQFIKEQYNQNLDNCSFSVIETNGSNENIELLKNNVVDFAIIQRNVLINSIYNEKKGVKNLAVIAPLFQEKLLIYFQGNQPLNFKLIDSLSQVKPIKIGFTSKKSYSFTIYNKITKLLDINTSKTLELEGNYNDLITQFKNKELDIIISFSLPIQTLDTLSSVKKMYLSHKDAKTIEKRGHNLFITNINNNKNQYSLGSWSFLIGSRKSIQKTSSEKKLLTLLLKKIKNKRHKNISKIVNNSYSTFIQNKQNHKLQLQNLPIADALLSKIEMNNINNKSTYLIILLFIFGVIIIYFFFKKNILNKNTLLFFWYRYKHFQFGFLFLLIMYFSSIELMVYAEKSFYSNIGIKSPILNMTRQDLHSWLLITTVTGNSNGVFPLSLLGKGMLGLNSLNFWIGTILIGVSEFITYKINKKRKEGLMETKQTNHLVIFGWNTTAESFITETIRDAKNYINTKISIVCVVPSIDYVRKNHIKIRNLHDQKIIDIVQGDALDFHVLELSKVEKANTVILLSEDNSKLSDERTAMRAHAISRYTKKKKNNDISSSKNYISKLKNRILPISQKETENYKRYKIEKTADTIYMIAELNDDSFRESLFDADVNEVIVAGNYTKSIIKQSLFNHGISKVLDEIMQYNQYNEFYKIDLSKQENSHLQGKTFDQLLIALRTQGILLIGVHIVFHDHKNNIIIDQNIIQQLLLQEESKGITRDIIINPTDEAERNRVVDQDDHLIVLATNVKTLKEGVKKVVF